MSPQSYEQRINRVTDFIYAHLDEDLDLDRLADVAAMSPWHWHRVYAGMRGETVAATVRRLRLQRAATELVMGDAPIEAVARRSGYDNVRSFTRIFADAYGMPPARYRKVGSHAVFRGDGERPAPEAYSMRIADLPPQLAVIEPHLGSYINVGQAFERLFSKLGSRGLVGPGTRMIGLYYDDPGSIDEEKLRSKAGAILSGNLPDDMPAETLRGGGYAVLRHKGPYSDLPKAYDWLFGTWLPQSGRDAADAPVIEEYLNNPREVVPAELLTEIFVPLL